MWLHVISDAVITLSYYCILLALVYLVRKRRDIPFNWIFWMFGLFILGCGTTHLMEVWTVWHPTYFLSGVIKALTAAVSITTAIVLLQLIPKAIALPDVDQLYGLNRDLERQVETRARREQELYRLIEELELAVEGRTSELESINRSLEKETSPATFVESDRLMNQVRDTVSLMDGVERTLLNRRTQESLVAQHRTKIIIVLATMASAIFILIAGSAMGRGARRSGHLRGQLRKVNADLEQRVEQRTSALRESEARLGGVIESAMDAILTIDEQQQILLFNRAAEKMFLRKAGEVIGNR